MDEIVANAVSSAVDTIRAASIRQLVSPTWLEYELLPQLGLSDVNLEWYPPFLRAFCGKGLRSFQQPNQFSRYLCHLSRCKVASYLEIGVWHGGTFIITVEYLSRFNDVRCALAVDVDIQPPMAEYAKINDRVSLYKGDSKDPEAKKLISKEWWDLALIDADHSEEGCMGDYRIVRDFAGMIALHDVFSDLCPAVTAVWQHLTAIYPRLCFYEFNEQYVDVLRAQNKRMMGIGLIDTGIRA